MRPSSLPAILASHCRRYPLLKAQDIYKLVHQGVYGPGHIISSVVAAESALAAEVRSQKAESRRQIHRAEELVEEIDPRGKLVRVNLRPFVRAAEVRSQKAECRRQNSGLDGLAEAMVESARRVQGDPAEMKRRLAAAVRWCRENLPGQAAELERIAARAEESGFPAFHHSSAYAKAYRPAYRVVLASCLDQGQE